MADSTTRTTRPVGPVSRWSITIRFDRQPTCPRCGQPLNAQAVTIVNDLIWCYVCGADPDDVLQYLTDLAYCPSIARHFASRCGIRAYFPRRGGHRPLFEVAREEGLVADDLCLPGLPLWQQPVPVSVDFDVHLPKKR